MPNPTTNVEYAQVFGEIGQVNLSVEMKIQMDEVSLYSEEIEQLRAIAAELEEEPEVVCRTLYAC